MRQVTWDGHSLAMDSTVMSAGERWPSWVYGGGDEPDPRSSFANERTFLAWIRTALALLAAGVALDAINLPLPAWLQLVLAGLFIILGLSCAVASWTRWARAERAMRHGNRFPLHPLVHCLSAVVALSALALSVAGLGEAGGMSQQEPGSGVYNERTALAWQRTALALLAGAAIVSRLALDRLGVFALCSVVVAVPVMGWVLWVSRQRYQTHAGTRPGVRERGGRAAVALAGVAVVIGVTEMAALLARA